MKKLITIFLFSLSTLGYGQTKNTYTRLGSDFIAPNKGGQHWGTTNWDDVYAPRIPAGNGKPMNFYTRFNWLDIESNTVQGSYSWTVFDAFVNQAIDSGAMFSFGVMSFCNGCGSFGQVPSYLVTLMSGEGKPAWSDGGFTTPNYQSTSYPTRYCALLRAIANHIATTSRSGHTYASAFLGFDLRHFGNFGEGNGTSNSGGCPSTAQITDAYMNAMVDSAIAIFPNVQLTIPMSYVAPYGSNYGNTNGQTSTASAYHVLTSSNSYGRIGWRRDNLGDDGYNSSLSACTGSYNPGTGLVQFQPLIMAMYKYAPIGGEPANDYCGTSRGPSVYYDMFYEDTLFHLSYFGNANYPILVTDNSNVNCSLNTPANKTHGGDSLILHMRNASAQEGYKLVVDSAITTTAPVTGGTLSVSLYWGNIGIAPNYENWNVQYELRQSATVKLTATSSFTPRLFLPTVSDAVNTDNINLTGLAAGTYDLYLIIRDPNSYKKPLPLAITGVNADGSYLLRSGINVGSSCSCHIRVKAAKPIVQ